MKPKLRAFSLVEVLIALAIVAGLALVAWPNIAAMRGRASLESASSSVEAAAAECRASAIRAGQPMRLVVRAPDLASRASGFSGLTALYVEAVDHVKALSAKRSSYEAGRGSAGSGRLLAHLDSSVVVSGSLERDADATTSSPSDAVIDTPATHDAGARTARTAPGESTADGGDGGELTLATFMPDGSAIAAHPAFLRARHDTGGAMRIDVNRWSGRLDLSPVAVSPDEPDAGPRPARPASRGKNDR